MSYTIDLHRAVISYLKELDHWRDGNITSDQLHAAEGMLRAVIWEPKQYAINPGWTDSQVTIWHDLPKLPDPWYRVAWRALFGRWF